MKITAGVLAHFHSSLVSMLVDNEPSKLTSLLPVTSEEVKAGKLYLAMVFQEDLAHA